MRIAVASDGLDVAPKFMECPNFNCYSTVSYEIVDAQNLPTHICGGDDQAKLLSSLGVDVVVCSEIAPTSRKLFEDEGITVQEGASGKSIDAARAYLEAKAAEIVADEPQPEDE